MNKEQIENSYYRALQKRKKMKTFRVIHSLDHTPPQYKNSTTKVVKIDNKLDRSHWTWPPTWRGDCIERTWLSSIRYFFRSFTYRVLFHIQVLNVIKNCTTYISKLIILQILYTLNYLIVQNIFSTNSKSIGLSPTPYKIKFVGMMTTFSALKAD